MVMCMLYCLEQDWEQVKIATRAQSLDQYEVAKSQKMTCTSPERAASEASGLTGPGVPAVFQENQCRLFLCGGPLSIHGP